MKCVKCGRQITSCYCDACRNYIGDKIPYISLIGRETLEKMNSLFNESYGDRIRRKNIHIWVKKDV